MRKEGDVWKCNKSASCLPSSLPVFLWPPQSEHPASTCLSRLPPHCKVQRKGSVSVFVKLTLLRRVQRLSSLSISLGLEIKLPHKFPPSHAGCAAVYLRGVACNIRLAPHCMFYLSGVEEQDVPKKQTVLAGQCLR